MNKEGRTRRMDTELTNTADQIATTFEYMDSLSQAGSRSSRKNSIASGASSASSSRLRASAEKAALQAEIAVERKRQALEEEELKLHQRRRQMELETKLARASAIEKTFAEAENLYEVNTSTPFVQPVTTHNKTPSHDPEVNQDNSFSSSTGSTDIPSLSTPAGDTPSNLNQLVKAMQMQQQSLVETLQLPKTELMTFDGDPAKYWVFIRSFENAVEKDTVSDAAKLARLQQYCTGAARKLIQCCAVKTPSEGYALARKLLKERFGNEYDIAEAWINKIVNRPDIRDSRALLDYADDLRNCRETLDTMDKLCELNNSRSLAQMVEKLPWDVRKAWLKRVYHIKTVESRSPTIDDVVKFVKISAQQANDPVYSKLVSRDRADKSMKDVKRKDTSMSKHRSNFVTQVDTTPSPQHTKGTSQNASSEVIARSDKPQRSCWYCGRGHGLFGCDSWKALKVTDRLNFVQTKRLCVNCLQPGHRARDCSRDAVCTVPGCGLKHTKFLHLTRTGNPSTPTNAYPVKQGDQLINNAVPVTINAVPTTVSANATCNTSGAGSGRIALPIVPVKVRSHRSATNFVTTYALLDSGSTQTFCSEELINKLGVDGKPDTMRLTTIDNHDILTETRIVHLEVTDMCDENLVVMTHVLTRPKLQMGTSTLVERKEINKWPHLSDVILPDVDIEDVHLLIGQDNPSALIPKEVREGGAGTPYATRTKLGWTLNGPFETGPLSRSTSFFIDTDTSLQQQVEKFWKLDGTGGDERSMSISDKKVISTWEQSLCRDGAHYSMNIPFKMRPPQLPDNKAVAEQRLRLLGRRLGRDSDMKEKYIAGIQDLMNKGYAEEVPQNDLNREDGAVWYLPHHPVLHPRKPGKVRIVFDCAARYRGVSLNDKVHQGPDMTNKLVGVLIQFRQDTIALMADVEGMFHQVHVNKPDRDVLRFLWWADNDISGVPKTFRMTSHLFGGIWSPSCATFALKRTAQDNMEGFDANTIDTIDNNFYVDDCLKSVATEQEAIRLVRQLREVLASGGFRLTKWISNSREVLRSVPEAERAKGVPSLDLDQTLPAERALGVLWDIESDTFTFNVNVTEKPLTRRGLLGTVSSVYDPLGYASPFVLTAKILFQSLCRMKIGWDDPIPDSIKEQWIRWMADLPLLQKMSIPRCVKPLNYDTITSAQLHHFADASERGFGAVTYLRLQDSSGLIHCVLLMAKAKLAPLKTTTIPRLELAAAVISVKLDETMHRHLTLPLQESIYWSDSMIVLQYLRNEDKRFQTFVANRVSKILENSTPQQWKHVDTSSNPADDVSRGLQAQQLIDSKRWLHGPHFLRLEEDRWPQQPEFDKMTLPIDMELKTVTQVYSVEATKDIPEVVDTLLERYSSWYRLRRAVAWILRAKAILLARVKKTDLDFKPSRYLTVKEIQAAENKIIRRVQQTNFDETLLKSGGYRKLNPTRSGDGIIQVGGRLANASFTDNIKHPWILPTRHPLTTLIIRHYHTIACHSGSERTLADIRQKFWIIKGRTAVKNVINSCIPCRKQRAPMMTQQMADLPKDRVTPELPPFSMVGVDFFGPFLVKRARSMQKRYGCIFTCLATRAIHLEVCHSLDTDSFINAMQRFISRRGKPVEIRSDNGTNFVGGVRELRQAILEWNQDHIDSFLCQKEIQWIFNPPAASHFGGVWERQIRTVRAILNNLLHQQTLDDEGLLTLMCLVEGIVNGRPITKLSDDMRDPMPLTPNHLLLLRSGPQLPPGKFVKQDIYRRRWRQVQYLSDIFWQRWLKEYLPQLQERQKWLHPQRNVRSGDLVLVMHENTPRYQWPLGLVRETFHGKDGKVRSVQLKTQSGVYTRPIDKLCLLEGEEIQTA